MCCEEIHTKLGILHQLQGWGLWDSLAFPSHRYEPAVVLCRVKGFLSSLSCASGCLHTARLWFEQNSLLSAQQHPQTSSALPRLSSAVMENFYSFSWAQGGDALKPRHCQVIILSWIPKFRQICRQNSRALWRNPSQDLCLAMGRAGCGPQGG